MAARPTKEVSPVFAKTAGEIMKIYKSLPPRPTIEEIEAARSVFETVNSEKRLKLDEISGEVAEKDSPPELYSVFKEVKRTLVLFQAYEQKKEATHLIEIDKFFEKFDELIQRVSELVNGEEQSEKIGDNLGEVERIGDDFKGLVKSSSLKTGEANEGFMGLNKSSSSIAPAFSSGGETKKLSLMKVAAIIESSAKNKEGVLNLRGKLMDKVEWLPTSITKLSHMYELDLSENKIMALPININSLKALTKLDLHSNQLINLPDTFGELVSLTHLDLHSNMCKSLPSSFSNLMNLIDLDLGSNNFTHLPDFIGNLASLKRLNAEMNELEELPYTIGSCSSIVELRLDFNQIKALPEAIGKLSNLEILALHYNRIGKLPTTMGNLLNLRELDVSFNEIEAIPESLCFSTKLVKLIVGKNFADLRALPRSIGNLEMLEELDISDNQIRVLPDSFKFLSNLRVFRADETPLEVPPREVAMHGAQAVVQYMADYVAKRDLKSQQPKKKKGFFSRICTLLFCH